jgi:hypothetical protein
MCITSSKRDDSTGEAPAEPTTSKEIRMKLRTIALSAVTLALLALNGWASDKMKAHIMIYQAVTVGSTQLSPGDYTMTWAEGDAGGEVTFSQGKNVIATIPAEITQGSSGYKSPAIISDANVLTGIALPKTSFLFTKSSAVTGK